VGHRFAELAFTKTVKNLQARSGSRENYARMEGGEDFNNLLTAREAAFITARDSFYMASVSETGWPYVQHRGGPIGFLRTLNEKTIGFADFKGNRQYVSVGNLTNDDRVSLFFMDYAHKKRLKILGRVRFVGPEDWQLLAKLELSDYRARVERGIVISIEAFDWNCPQHITPRYTEAEIQVASEPLHQRIADLEAELTHLKSNANRGSPI
jgi:predicted pyridoxine 5'-phosphate oxidase superfamily flavin-nucleotide-binding protein